MMWRERRTAREVNATAAAAGLVMLEPPVSGGLAGAEVSTLTFMVGGGGLALAAAEPIPRAMGKLVIHTGGARNGQAAKICNNLILGISMVAVCEAFDPTAPLGLPAQSRSEVASTSSGQCWSLTSYCPVPGPVPALPANHAYQPGFAAAMLLKDPRLAEAASAEGALPVGAHEAALYAEFVAQAKVGPISPEHREDTGDGGRIVGNWSPTDTADWGVTAPDTLSDFSFDFIYLLRLLLDAFASLGRAAGLRHTHPSTRAGEEHRLRSRTWRE